MLNEKDKQFIAEVALDITNKLIHYLATDSGQVLSWRASGLSQFKEELQELIRSSEER